MSLLSCIQMLGILVAVPALMFMIYGRFSSTSPWFKAGATMSMGGALTNQLCHVLRPNADVSKLDLSELVLFSVLFGFAAWNWAHKRRAAHLGGDA